MGKQLYDRTKKILGISLIVLFAMSMLSRGSERTTSASESG